MLDINTLAAWGEFLGGIAVVVSLIYLASQIRQNSRLVRASTTTAANQVEVTLNALLAQDPEVSRIFWDGISDRDSLSEADRRRFDPIMQLFFQPMRQQFHFEHDGVGSPSVWAGHALSLAWIIQQPGARQWLREWDSLFPHDLRDYLDGLIREGEAAG